MIGGTASIAQVTLATDPNATDLGGGWYELSIPFSQFSNNDGANLANHSGFLVGMPGDNGATAFDFYFTDVSVSGTSYPSAAVADVFTRLTERPGILITRTWHYNRDRTRYRSIRLTRPVTRLRSVA